MLELLKDLWRFMKVRKKFWLAPVILVLLLLGSLIVLSQGSAVAPFIYTLFYKRLCQSSQKPGFPSGLFCWRNITSQGINSDVNCSAISVCPWRLGCHISEAQ